MSHVASASGPTVRLRRITPLQCASSHHTLLIQPNSHLTRSPSHAQSCSFADAVDFAAQLGLLTHATISQLDAATASARQAPLTATKSNVSRECFPSSII
ncbi:hypothetical protein TcWFU_009063 [Taenia crassiceps]